MAGPLTEQLGFDICTVLLQVNGQPSQEPLTVRVNEPEAPAVTLTEGPLCGPTICPSPLMLQVRVSAPTQPSTLRV